VLCITPVFKTDRVLGIIPLISALMVDDYYLGKTQNAVDDKVHPMYAGGTAEGGEAAPTVRST
jgi:hypothetical protein